VRSDIGRARTNMHHCKRCALRRLSWSKSFEPPPLLDCSSASFGQKAVTILRTPSSETFPMFNANDAIEHLRSGKARYRVVLVNDL